jgi:Ca2+:H+ antiporter
VARLTTTKALEGFSTVGRRERVSLGIALGATVLGAILHFAEANAILVFVATGAALAVLAVLVGDATDQLGTRLGPGATGVLQSALGNLPELFVGIFALRAGLTGMAQAALIASILGNSVLGLAFLVGGLRHGTQRFGSDAPRTVATLTLLAVAALAIPTLAHLPHTPAEPHADVLSAASAVVLLVVFIASIPVSLRGGPTAC